MYVTTQLKKRTLKKLLIDCCTKTTFSSKIELYQQIDGVSMGSPLGPTRANFPMTAFEDEIVRPLINEGTIKFHARNVNDTLVLTEPKDIPSILDKFNSFHPQIQFTCEEIVDNNDVHFFDIKINSLGTTIYRKSTHTGQYSHYSSFTPWLRALVQRAQKICSTHNLLNNEIQKIKDFASWNGFPRWSVNKIIKIFTTKPNEPGRTEESEYQQSGLNCPSLERKVVVSCEAAHARSPDS